MDSVSSAQVIKHLRELAHDGRTIICVIHQPSSSLFQLFDDLYVLSNGNCIFHGPLETMVDTFKQAGFNCPSYYNRADYALEVASLQRNEGSIDQLIAIAHRDTALPSHALVIPEEHQALLMSSLTPSESLSCQTQPQNASNYPISTWRQILILTQRSMLCTSRDLVCSFQYIIFTTIYTYLHVSSFSYLLNCA